MATLNTPAGSRPNAQGMSQGTYTGNVSFSRGNSDLISKGANLPSGGAGATSGTPAKQASEPSGPRYLSGVTFNNNGNQARGF